MKKAEQHVRSLLEKTIDLDELEVEITKLKPRFSQIDEELVTQLQQKYNDGREIQQSCRNIIQSALENEFTEEGIKTIEVFIKDAKKLNLDLPEFHRLETVKLIPKWVNRLHTIVCETFGGANKSETKEGNTQSQQNSQAGSGSKKEPKIKKLKPLRTLRQEVMKGLDSLEPSKMSATMKQELIDALSKNMPQVLDEELNKLLQKVQLILWIKDAFDLLGKESIALSDLVLLKDNPIKIDTSFKHLKFKQATYHKQIVDLINQQETWMNKAVQIETKYPQEEISTDRTKFDSFKKSLETLKKGMNAKIEKISEVKDKFTQIQQQQLQIEWALECGEFLRNDSERKKLEDLESYYRRAEACKVTKQWASFQALEALYQQVKELVVKSKKLIGSKMTEEKMDIEKDSEHEIIDYEKKQKDLQSKVTMDELDQLYERMKNLNDRVDFDNQIECLEQSKKSQEKYIQLITRCYNAHQSQMENFQDTPTEDLLTIRSQIQEISKLEHHILVAQPKFDAYYLKLHWSIDCAFFLSSSPSIKMKRDLEECKKLVNASAVIKDIENSKLCKKLNEQLNIFIKCKDAVDQLKKDTKKKKSEERESLITMQQFSELENALRTITIEESKAYFKEIQKMKRKLEQIISEYDQAVQKNDKQPLKFWKEILDQFHQSKIPVKCDEECLLEVLIKDAEEMDTSLKAAKKSTGSASKKSSTTQSLSQEVIEILERYRLQQVKLPEAEKLLEKWKIKEDALSVIEKKVYGSEHLTYDDIIDFNTQINTLKSQFKGERMEKLIQEIFLKKIHVLKDLWDNNKETDSTLQMMQESLEKAKVRFVDRKEPRFSQATKFLEDVVAKCEARIQEIEEVTNPKELESALKHSFKNKNQSLKYVNYVNMSPQIVDKLARLKIDLEKQKQRESEKKQMEKQLAKERQQEEERKQKTITDVRIQKKKEVEDKKREADDKAKEKIAKEKKQNSQIRQNMISDISKAINETWKNITLQDCLLHGTALIDRLFIENSNSTTATLDHCVQYAKLFLELKKLPNLCAQVKKQKFDFTELARLLELSRSSKKYGQYKDALEKEEKMIEINNNITKNENNLILDVKFKKKEIPGETNTTKIEGSVPTKKQKTESIALSLLLNDQIDNYIKDKPEDSSYVNIDDNNMVKKSIAKIREGKMSTIPKGTSVSSKSKKFGVKFSDDEDEGKSDEEYVPLREEDFQSLNESLILQHHKQMKEKQNLYLQFNPDDEIVSQRQDEALDSSSVISLLKGSFEIQLPNGGQSQIINRIYVLTCEDAKQCMLMPSCPTRNQTMSMKGVLGITNFTQYHNSLLSERQLNPERKTHVVSGWFECEQAEDSQKLESYAIQLKQSKRVAVVEWTPECKLYIMHRDQWNTKGNEGHEIKFKRNFFHYSRNPNDSLLYIMIFKQFKLPNYNEYDRVRPIFMQKRFLASSSYPPHVAPFSSSSNALQNNPLTESGRKLQKIVNNYNTEKVNTNSIKQNLQAQADLDSSFNRGKKSFNKMSLESLAMKDGNDYDEDELNERLNGIRNKFLHFENNLKSSQPQLPQRNNTFQSVNKYENNSQQQRLNNIQPPHLQQQQQPSNFQPSVHQQQQNAFSRYSTAQKQQQQSNYPRSANRSGVNTPNYYESKYNQQQQQSFNEPSYSQQNQSFQQQHYNKPNFQRTLNFNNTNNKLNESMEVEDYNLSFRGSVFNSQSQSQQVAPSYHQSQSQQIAPSYHQSQQSNAQNFMNSQQNSQESFYKQPFKGPVKGFKRTYGAAKQIPERLSQVQRSMENLSQNSQSANFEKILMSLDKTMKELMDRQQTKNENVITTLLEKQHHQQQIIDELQKKNHSQGANSQSVNGSIAGISGMLGDKKKKSRKRTKKRTSTAAGLNNSISADEGSFMSDESQESVSRSYQNSQTLSQSQQLPSRNIQIQRNFQAPSHYKNQDTSFNNHKKGLKMYEKQTQKLSNQHERTTNTTTTTTQQFGNANTQQPHFTKNNQTLKQDSIPMHNPNFQQIQQQQVGANLQKELELPTNNKQPQQQPHNLTIPGLNYSNMVASSTTTGSNSSNNINKSNGINNNLQPRVQGQPTIKFTTTGPAPLSLPNNNKERYQVSNNNNSTTNQQPPQSSQPPNSLTALNQLMKQNHQLQPNKQQPNSSQNSQTLSINHSRAHQMLHLQDSQSQFSQEQTPASISNTQETNKILGIRDLSTRITDSSKTPAMATNTTAATTTASTTNTNFKNHRLPPQLAFRNTQKGESMDLETTISQPQQQLQASTAQSINHSLERQLLTDLSKSGRVNQEKANNFLSLRGEIKEANNTSNNNEIPRYLKERSVRNPTFYPANKETKPENTESSQAQKKIGFSYSSVSSRDGSLEKLAGNGRNFPTEKENAIRRFY